MSDPYRPNYYGNTYAPQEQYGEAPYPGNGYSQVRPSPSTFNNPPSIKLRPLSFAFSHSHPTSTSSSCPSPATRLNRSPLRTPSVRLFLRSPIPSMTATTPAHDRRIPTVAVTMARAPATQAALAPPNITETRAARRESELRWLERRGADCWDTRLAVARSGRWEARWWGRSVRMRWRKDMSGMSHSFLCLSLCSFQTPRV